MTLQHAIQAMTTNPVQGLSIDLGCNQLTDAGAKEMAEAWDTYHQKEKKRGKLVQLLCRDRGRLKTLSAS